MHSTSAPSEINAVLYDGQTAIAHPVRVEFADDGLVLYRQTCEPERLFLASLRLGDTSPGRTVLRHVEKTGWRLILSDDLPDDWGRALVKAGRPSKRKIAIWTCAGASTIALLVGLYFSGDAILERLAPLVPHSVTDPIGRQVVHMFAGESQCRGTGGQMALRSLVAKLQPDEEFAEPVKVYVVDSPVVNALAAPGGHVLIFSQLIKEAESPDEVAGVLAHELGHVQHRHATQGLIRHFGVSLILQAVGGDFGALADMTLVLNRTRRAESQADAWAVERLRHGGISTAGLVSFFSRHAKGGDSAKHSDFERALERLNDYASTHPSSKARAALFQSAELPPDQLRPALTDAEWQALRAICK